MVRMIKDLDEQGLFFMEEVYMRLSHEKNESLPSSLINNRMIIPTKKIDKSMSFTYIYPRVK